ncbi:MAG: hypothetical protein AAFR21_10460 [Pseudomonadota bacterium]
MARSSQSARVITLILTMTTANTCADQQGGSAMVAFLIFFFGVVLLFGVLFFEISQVDNKAIKNGYGPKLQISGAQSADGKLVCVNANAPTLNKSISFPYSFRLNSSKGNLTGAYKYKANRSKFHDTVYNGELFLSFNKDHVKGRTLMGGLKTVDGVVDATKARLVRGHPKQSFLSFMNGPYEYSVHRGKVRFDKTTLAGNISKESDLRIERDRISGRVFHGPQKTWAVDVDVRYNNITSEKAALAVILACNDILSVHHGD